MITPAVHLDKESLILGPSEEDPEDFVPAVEDEDEVVATSIQVPEQDEARTYFQIFLTEV